MMAATGCELGPVVALNAAGAMAPIVFFILLGMSHGIDPNLCDRFVASALWRVIWTIRLGMEDI